MPNIEAIRWFLAEVWLQINKRFPGLEFHFAGRNAPNDLVNISIPQVYYHPEVGDDLRSLGKAEAAAVLRAIGSRIHRGQPDQIGKPLSGELAGCRRVRVGANRIVYEVDESKTEVFILAIGPRRRDEVYERALRRWLSA